MQFKVVSTTALALSLAPSILAIPSPVAGSPDSSRLAATEYSRQVALNHLGIWSGDFSLINKTWLPNVHLYQDRNPEPNGSINLGIVNADEYLGYIIHARSGFSKLTVHPRYILPEPCKVAVRWTLESTVGANITQIAPLTYVGSSQGTLKPGDKVSYNGTDVLLLDQEFGLAYEVDSAFNIIDYEYELGYKSINVG